MKGRAIVLWMIEKGGFFFHNLRHTFNTYMGKAGGTQSVITKQYGAFLRSVDQTFDQVAVDQ